MQQEVKNTAKTLADALNKMGYRLEGEELGHGHALDLISKVLGGVKDWNALSAELSVMPAGSDIAKLTNAAENVVTSYDNTGCDSCGVIDERVKDNLEAAIESVQASGKFVITSDKEEGFWSNKDGWGEFCPETTIFSAKEKSRFNLPSIGVKDATWLPLTEVDGYFEVGKRYVRRGGTRCPFCGSEDISGNEWNADGGWATQEMGCDNCNAQWQDVYKLETIYVQSEGDEQVGAPGDSKLEDDQFQCVHCGQVHDNDDSIQTEVGLICDECDEKVVRDAIDDWKYEVENGDTGLGFEEWMLHRREDAENDPESCIQCGCDVRFDGFCSNLTCLYSDWLQSTFPSLYADFNALSEGEFAERYGQFKKGYKAPTKNAIVANTESLPDQRRKVADRAFADWNFPLEVVGDSGWDVSTSTLGSDWEKPVFLQNPHGDSMKVTLSLSFKNDDIVPECVSCLDQYGQYCGHGPLKNYVVMLDIGDEQDACGMPFDCEAESEDHAKTLAKVVYPAASIIRVRLA